jgi:hypothetical protein
MNPSKTPSEFAYVTDDTIAVVLGAGYFNSLFDVLKINDMIKVTAEANTATPTITIVRVSANTNKVVTVEDGTDLV